MVSRHRAAMLQHIADSPLSTQVERLWTPRCGTCWLQVKGSGEQQPIPLLEQESDSLSGSLSDDLDKAQEQQQIDKVSSRRRMRCPTPQRYV